MSVVMIRVLVGLCGGPHNCHLIRISVCLSLSLIFCLFWLKKHWLFDRDWKKEKFYIHTRVLLGLGCTRCPLLLCFVSLLSSHLITSDFSHPCGKWLFWRIEDFKIATAIFSLIIWHHRREKNIETNKKKSNSPKRPKTDNKDDKCIWLYELIVSYWWVLFVCPTLLLNSNVSLFQQQFQLLVCILNNSLFEIHLFYFIEIFLLKVL